MTTSVYESNIGLMLFVQNKPTPQHFVDRARVHTDSYAEQLARRLYWHLWGATYDMEEDYQTYYDLEYEDFRTYLRKKHACSWKTIEVVERELATEGVKVFLRLSPYSSDGNIDHFFQDYGFSFEASAQCLDMALLGADYED